MHFLTGFLGTIILVPAVNFLLTALIGIPWLCPRWRKLLLGVKEHLVFFAVLGVGLWIGLNYEVNRLGNNVPSGIWCAMLIEVWVFMPRWAKLSTPDSPKVSWLQL